MNTRKNPKSRAGSRRVRPKSRGHNTAQKHLQKMARAGTLPLKECRINSNWQEQGFANILISRRREDGDLALASFLVDLGCLGVKDAVADISVTLNRYKKHVDAMERFGASERIAVEMAVKIIESAVAYAAELGFEPSSEFALASQIYKGTEGDDTEVICGKDGKPFFASSPDDNIATTLAKLQEKLGEDGFGHEVDAMPGIRVEPGRQFGPSKS